MDHFQRYMVVMLLFFFFFFVLFYVFWLFFVRSDKSRLKWYGWSAVLWCACAFLIWKSFIAYVLSGKSKSYCSQKTNHFEIKCWAIHHNLEISYDFLYSLCWLRPYCRNKMKSIQSMIYKCCTKPILIDRNCTCLFYNICFYSL